MGAVGIAAHEWRQSNDAIVPAAGDRPVGSSTVMPSDARPETAATTPPTSGADPSREPTADLTDQRVPAPRRVSIPVIGVATRIVPVGLRRDGALAIPDDVSLVGWYELGVPPGADRGSAVLVAHRDGRGQGRGVFYELGRLDVGDELTVRTSSGGSLGFRVVARESIRKQRLPYEELFAADGTPRLTLISCGGVYDPDHGGYQDNIVVTAVPLPDPSPAGRA